MRQRNLPDRTESFAARSGLHRDLPTVIAFEALRERGYEWFDVSYRMLGKTSLG